MTSAEAFRKIEEVWFSAAVNVASNLKTFLHAVRAQPEVRDLWGQMQAPEVCREVCERAQAVARSEADDQFEHPLDAALGTYIYLLSLRAGASPGDEALPSVAATAVGPGHRWRWARKIADIVLAAEKFPSGTGVGFNDAPSAPPSEVPRIEPRPSSASSAPAQPPTEVR